MAESADAPDSGSGGSNTVCVQVTLSAPRRIGTFKALTGFEGACSFANFQPFSNTRYRYEKIIM